MRGFRLKLECVLLEWLCWATGCDEVIRLINMSTDTSVRMKKYLWFTRSAMLVIFLNHPQVPVLFPSPKHWNGSLTPLCLPPESWLWTSPLRPVGRECVATPSWSLRSTCWTPRVCRDKSPTEVRPALVPPQPHHRSTGICMSMILVESPGWPQRHLL